MYGLSDPTVPVEEFASLDLDRSALGIEHIFITENEIKGIAFPSWPGNVVILGLGYALNLRGDGPWLHRVHIHYWGDIDTHGFAILARLRKHLPHTRSLLMDREALE